MRRPQVGQAHSSAPDSLVPLRIISCCSDTDISPVLLGPQHPREVLNQLFVLLRFGVAMRAVPPRSAKVRRQCLNPVLHLYPLNSPVTVIKRTDDAG